MKVNRDWLKRFLTRYPDLRIRKSLSKKISDDRKFDKEKARAFVTELDMLKNKGRFDDPRRIGNLDESGFQMGAEDKKVIIAKSRNRVESYTKGKHDFLEMLPGWYLYMVIMLREYT